MINNFFWDFDKTISNTGDIAVVTTQKVFEICGLPIPEKDIILSYMGIPAEVSFPKMVNRLLSKQETKDLINAFRNEYDQAKDSDMQLYPNILSTLTQLHLENKRMFIVSSKKTDALIKNIKNLKIQLFFEKVVGCDLVQKYKPDPEALLILIDKYQIDKKQCVMIGDAKYDIQMGKAAGIQTCGAAWGAFSLSDLQREQPTYLFDNPMQLLKIK